MAKESTKAKKYQEFKLDDATKDTVQKASTEQSSAFLGGVGIPTPQALGSDPGSPVQFIKGGKDALAQVPMIAMQVTATVTVNVATYAGQRLGEVMGELLMPPSVAEIIQIGSKLMSDFMKTPGELMKELTTNAEDLDDEAAKDAQKAATNEKVKKQKEKAAKMKESVEKVAKTVGEKCKMIENYVAQGPAFLEKNANEIQQKAMQNIDKYIEKSAGEILKQKKEFIESQAQGYAKQKADLINKKVKDGLKKSLDAVAKAKQKVINIAKALIGKALLNVMALLGL